MQLMRRFQSDKFNMQLHQEAKEWPDANFFLDALPNPSHDILSPADFDTTVTPGPKSVISSLSPELMPHLSKLFSKIYPTHSVMLENGDIFLPSTFRTFSTINWHGQSLHISKQCYVFAVPPFPFPCSSSSAFEAPERLAKIEYFMLHTISLPGHTDPCSHLFACMFWPMVHPNLHHYGKPVQVWSKDIYEPHLMNKFCLASCISSCAIM